MPKEISPFFFKYMNNVVHHHTATLVFQCFWQFEDDKKMRYTFVAQRISNFLCPPRCHSPGMANILQWYSYFLLVVPSLTDSHRKRKALIWGKAWLTRTHTRVSGLSDIFPVSVLQE